MQDDPRFALLTAMTPALAADGWRSIDTVPKDGTEVQIRIVHMLAAYSDDPKEDRYIATARAHWIDHNGGGLTWYGLAGSPCQWRPIQQRELPVIEDAYGNLIGSSEVGLFSKL